MRCALATWGFCLSLAVPLLLAGRPALAKPAGSEAPEGATGGTTVSEPLSLDWSLSPSDNKLRIHYTLRNNGHERVYVLDQMVVARGQSFEKAPQAVVVRNGEEPGTVEFIRGYVNPGHPVLFQFAPAARSLDPGKSIEGTAEVNLPLSPWHPYGHLAPVKGVPQSAVLEIGYVSGGALQWGKVPLKDGSSLSAPTLPTAVSQQHLVRSAPRPLPPR